MTPDPIEDLKDQLHDLLLFNSRPDGACSLWRGNLARLRVMGIRVSLARVAAWIWGCEGLPDGWDLFDERVQVMQTCLNIRCTSLEHLRGWMVPAERRQRPALAERARRAMRHRSVDIRRAA